MGVFEFSNFENGSKSIMNYLAESNKTVIIGGGDTSSCCEKYNLTNKMTHVSTGGGASLELLEGKELPGIKFIK
jgi:3-phosphoglycerate kinase